MSCPHRFTEMVTAAHADGMCPLCMADMIKRLKAALEPFAKIADDDRLTGAGYDDNDEWFRYDGSVLLIGDFRRASAALAGTEG